MCWDNFSTRTSSINVSDTKYCTIRDEGVSFLNLDDETQKELVKLCLIIQRIE